MAPAANGDTVKIHYTGTLDDGYKFDSSYDHLEPLEFTIGRGEMIRGFEQAVVGMEPGETKIVRIASNQAYGRHNPEKVIQVSRSKMPEGLEQEIGMRVQGSMPDGQTVEFTIVSLTESEVTLDGNHALAGKDLTFDIELLEIA
ncbi:MAG TPA: peptidylprolyl isomerase [Dehalococcoidia bacterium]|nr:peptidylprolyl isomerase [Dehalococcoidia bacterium]HIM16762.1 peptidylprolyl isomerase [Dehalococcoidia bacterium]|tara:strand:- start:29 stop:460 length:432 start_codon:yes stop_codon:yes gene_type:complete